MITCWAVLDSVHRSRLHDITAQQWDLRLGLRLKCGDCGLPVGRRRNCCVRHAWHLSDLSVCRHLAFGMHSWPGLPTLPLPWQTAASSLLVVCWGSLPLLYFLQICWWSGLGGWRCGEVCKDGVLLPHITLCEGRAVTSCFQQTGCVIGKMYGTWFETRLAYIAALLSLDQFVCEERCWCSSGLW